MRRAPCLLSAVALAFMAGVALVLGVAELARPVGAAPRDPGDSTAVARATIAFTDELSDVALAVYDSAAPRIYLHRRLIAQMGPALGAFLLAHEQGHLAYHHDRRRGFGLLASTAAQSTLWAYEFAADCYAVHHLARTRPDAVVAAVRFFQRRAALRTDADHPPMGERAQRMLACLAAADR
jgi:Zn-dependent protease with chaperone function